MYEIPKPELLDPNRADFDDREGMTDHDHRTQAQLLAKALTESCEYADQLWEQVNALRGYLLESLPPDPRSARPHDPTCASPTGPDDEAGWTAWVNAFATTTSVLCGAHGDSGFGLSRAREEARLRRSAPELTLHARHPARSAPPQPQAPLPAGAPEQQPAEQTSTTESQRPGRGAIPVAKAVAAVVVGALALRGLRARPPA